MKNLFAGSLAVAAAAGLSLSVQAASVTDEDFHYDTTADLYQVCSTPNDAAESLIASFSCRAFIEATVQYHDAVSDKKTLKRLICYPNGATIADGRQAFLAWAKANQDDKTLMGEQPVVGLVRALAAKYPCR
ncbi:MAG: Rap1a/Tai family immunity protein [Lamprobacter sp.]|uniref:Rap1a/Tai family immunity protein n=1 Tax=Lamprobacter sp. TaxID=3100796 RepID=UPI002B259232|nr:Rap1a/Tai family immunity protein [Lamprobacter sp.]MEA3639366.1 Rap1a/Tai family immunity protein [Lamprobacter sp.]